MRNIVLFDINRTVIEFPNIARSYHKATGRALDKYEYQEEMERLTKEGTFNKNDYDYSEWENQDIVKRQIEEGDLILHNIRRLREYHHQQYELRWFSGRTTSEDFISKLLSKRLFQGLVDITGHALYLRDDGPEGSHLKKLRALKAYALLYDDVVFIDDEQVILDLAYSEIRNITVISARSDL